MKLALFIREIENFILDLLYPTKCMGCGKKSEVICPLCISKLSKAERETGRDILAVFDYRDELIKKMIWELKYHHKRHLGEKLGQLLYDFLIEDIGDLKMYAGKSILIIPVPLSDKKKKLRGYNQAKSIALGFCQQGERGIFELKDKIIFKKTNTIPQAKITNRKRRLENVKGVFGIKNEKIVKGRTVIIIDDVTTTSGTITEIMKILKKSGAKKVVGFAVAH